jgi:adenine-specific DNA methylase
MADTDKRLFEVAFPLREASLDSVHEKSMRHGHISTIHIWPARRPLAACRAALISALLPDPGNREERDRLLEKLGGKVVRVVKKKKLPTGKTEEVQVEETLGGVLHWGREASPNVDWFRKALREANGGKPPKVLDPFGGGGAIPLEAMRLGCDVTAIDINPVAWFILKSTLDYPQRLAGQHRPLPDFALESVQFMEQFFKGTAKPTKRQLERNLRAVQDRLFPPQEVDLAWHVRAWGWWVSQQARAELDSYYPAIDNKAAVAYLWARTAKCKNCRATVPLLKTRWLCKRTKKRVLIETEPLPDRSGVTFSVRQDVAESGGNAAQRREHDKRIGMGTFRGKGPTLVVQCPLCNQPSLTTEDLRRISSTEGLGNVMMAVVVDGPDGKEYRAPTTEDEEAYLSAVHDLPMSEDQIPFGLPTEPTPGPAGGKSNSSSLRIYGLNSWKQVFSPRQLRAAITFVKAVRSAQRELAKYGYPDEWREAILSYLCLSVDRFLDYSSSLCMWHNSGEKLSHTFKGFVLPMVWDYCEVNGLSDTTGGFLGGVEWVAQVVGHALAGLEDAPSPRVIAGSSLSVELEENTYDLVLTDPPYYDAISYADVMDFFYVWLRRMVHGTGLPHERVCTRSMAPRWDVEAADGELIDNPWRFNGDKLASTRAYEDGMTGVFKNAHKALKQDGRLVVVFASKEPRAWESLVSAIIRAGFVVDASWPIQTEMTTRMRANASAALSSSVWIGCRKRPEAARPGWDTSVLTAMDAFIHQRLRDFWDAGIRGPDFVWAATGPALEAYSRHPVVKKANEPNQVMTVSEFLGHVRRIVVDFVVGQVLSHGSRSAVVSGLDDVTTYYILHRYDFGFDDAPIGACILYSISCNLTDKELVDRYDLLTRVGSSGTEEDAEAEGEDEVDADEDQAVTTRGNKVRLKQWTQRRRRDGGADLDGRPNPLIDQAHRLMHLWKAGDITKVDEYIDLRGLRQSRVFGHLLQALIELSTSGTEERTVLESLSNHIVARGSAYEDMQLPLES